MILESVRYPALVRYVHWSGVLLVLVAGPEGGRAARTAALAVHVALLLFVVVQPLLGILALWAEGDALPVPLTSWSIPPPFAMGVGAGELLEELHETVGNVFYAVIAVHVLAALWHHFVRHDAVLRRML